MRQCKCQGRADRSFCFLKQCRTKQAEWVEWQKQKHPQDFFFLPFFMEDTKNMLKFLGLLWSSTSKLYCISIQLWLRLVKIFEGSLRILRLLAGNERSSKILSRILRILREFLKIFQGSLEIEDLPNSCQDLQGSFTLRILVGSSEIMPRTSKILERWF